MRRALGHFLAYLLSAALSLTVLLWTLGATLGSPHYLEIKANSTHLYDSLGAQMTGISPDLIQSQINNYLPKIIDYLLANAPAPTVDFGSGSLPLLTLSPTILNITNALPHLGLLAPIAALVLTILIVVLAGERRFSVLARAAFGSAVGLAISAAALWFAPDLISASLARSGTAAIGGALSPFFNAIFHDISLHLAIAAVVLFGASLLLRLLHGAGRLRARFARPKESPAPPPTYGPN